MEIKIKNPLTGRLIYKNGKTHQKLIKDKVLDKDGKPVEMDIDQIISENRCWQCKCELSLLEDDINDDEWRCPECDEIYFSCPKCEKENNGKPVSGDCDTLWKGGFCEGCKHHFCDSHWQRMYDDFDSDEWELNDDPTLCSDCFKNKPLENEGDRFFWQIRECKCWVCDKELISTGKIDEWKCPKCNKIYYNCVVCQKDNENHPVSQDTQINDKGQWCQKCKHHFCIADWQNMENLSALDDDWYCDDCFSEDVERSDEE